LRQTIGSNSFERTAKVFDSNPSASISGVLHALFSSRTVMSSLFRLNLNQHLALFNRLAVLDMAVMGAAQLVADCLRQGGKLLICGNGGSAADSLHIASEFTGRFVSSRRPLAALALGTNCPELTSIGNDYSFAEVYARQVVGLGRAGDCLMAISTSGNSENVVRAVEAARTCGITSIGLLGHDGGKLLPLCDHTVVVPESVTARIQEAHILIGHTICGAVEQQLGLAPMPQDLA
jgi:D-sedoheptulose 7-phosphate isomerase